MATRSYWITAIVRQNGKIVLAWQNTHDEIWKDLGELFYHGIPTDVTIDAHPEVEEDIPLLTGWDGEEYN